MKMNDIKLIFTTVTLSLSALLIFNSVESCNEAVCASVVSKCLLTQSCKCELKNCSCCQECFTCLSYLYTDCCSCLDMCPKPNDTENELSIRSHIGMFSEPIPDLFQALMAEPDSLERWHTFTFPIQFDVSLFQPKIEKEIKLVNQNNEQEVLPRKNIVILNCTVAYMSQCMSMNKCKNSCQSTGASTYRWFHDGCCECVGHTCIDYGMNKSRCMNCPLTKEDSPEDKAAFHYDDEDDIEHSLEEKSLKQTQAGANRMSYNP